MKKRELYLEKIQLNKTFSMQVDNENQEYLNIYENDVVIDTFSLRKRIHTLFKLLQSYTNESDLIEERKSKLYGKAIPIKDDIYMQLNNDNNILTVQFYQQLENGEEELLYLTKTNYMAQKLFNMMLIPEKVLNEPNFQVLNPKLFKDFIEVMNALKI